MRGWRRRLREGSLEKGEIFRTVNLFWSGSVIVSCMRIAGAVCEASGDVSSNALERSC